MRTAAEYRELAAQCVWLAESARTPEHRGVLIGIAHVWLMLAREVELVATEREARA